MRNILLLFLFLSLCNSFGVLGQSPKNDLTVKEKQCFSEKCRALGLTNAQLFYQNHINITKAKDFRENGVDLQQMSRRWNGYTPLEQVLLVPYVVKARVVGMEDAPANYGQFKVMYSLAVEKTISGEKLPDRVEVYSRSTGGGNFFFNFNNEPVLQLGEEVVLYLTEMHVNLQQPKEKPPRSLKFEEISLKPAQPSGATRIFIPTVKYTIKNGRLFDAWNRPFAKEEEFSKLAEKLYKINKPKKFFSRGYC